MDPLYLPTTAFERLYWVPESARRVALHVDCFNDMLGDDDSPFNDPHDLDVRGESILRAELPPIPVCLRLVIRWTAHGETGQSSWAPYRWSEPDVDSRFGAQAVELQSDRVIRIMAGERELAPDERGELYLEIAREGAWIGDSQAVLPCTPQASLHPVFKPPEERFTLTFYRAGHARGHYRGRSVARINGPLGATGWRDLALYRLTSHAGWLLFVTDRVNRHVRPYASYTRHCPNRAELLAYLGSSRLARELCIVAGIARSGPA